MAKPQILAMLFSDLQGYSEITNDDLKEKINELNESFKSNYLNSSDHIFVKTWGDAFFICSRSSSNLVRIALQMRDFLKTYDWVQNGFPKPLPIRIALHSAEARIIESNGKADDVVGTQVDTTARIEPIVQPNEVYCSKSFYTLVEPVNNLGIRLDFIGLRVLAKGFGKMDLYSVRWEDEEILPIESEDELEVDENGAPQNGYHNIISGNQWSINEARKADVSVTLEETSHKIPAEFEVYNKSLERPIERSGYSSTYKCRLESYETKLNQEGPTNEFEFKLSKISYADYLIANNVLDEQIPCADGTTFRERYGAINSVRNFKDAPLSNICGVGIFLITSDDRIIVSRHSNNVSVYENAYSYSASGTMDWKTDVHPFDEVIRECNEEISHVPDINDLYLFGFGYDKSKIYFQFSFFEHTEKTSEELIKNAPSARDFNAEMEELIAMPFDCKAIVNHIKNSYWEPAAAFNLLSLCTKRFGLEKVNEVLDPEWNEELNRKRLKEIWNRRGERNGKLAVMSNRYPFARLETESRNFVDGVLHFIGDDLNDADILEIGCGIGRFTKEFAKNGRVVTAIDVSDVMISKNRDYLGAWANKVNYLNIPAQDYKSKERHDLSIISLVMVHHLSETFLKKLVESVERVSNKIYVFEHFGDKAHNSNESRIRTCADLLALFEQFEVVRQDEYKLFDDDIVFLEMTKK